MRQVYIHNAKKPNSFTTDLGGQSAIGRHVMKHTQANGIRLYR